jgi:hypothetical protein
MLFGVTALARKAVPADLLVGDSGLTLEVHQKLTEFFATIEPMCDFKNGSVAAFFHVAAILSQHIDKPKDSHE